MSLELVEQEVKKFIQSSGGEVLLLRGRWGIGKTFFWQRLVEDAARDRSLGCQSYAYVSLFGVRDLEAFKNTILVSRMKAQRIAAGHGSSSFNAKEMLKQVGDLPKIREWTGELATSLAFSSIRDTLICFDDLERKGEGFGFQEIFGLVTILKEQRNCRIAIIANEDTLEDESRDSFLRYSEKVVDINLEFVQSPEGAFACVFDLDDPCRAVLGELCFELGIVNIRILQRIWKK